MTATARRRRLIWSLNVVRFAVAMSLHLFIEYLVLGLGAGFTKASNSLSLWYTLILPSLVFAYLGALPQGAKPALHSLGFTLVGHSLIAAYVWIRFCTPYPDWTENPYLWLDRNPALYGTLLLISSVLLLLILIRTRLRSKEIVLP